MKVSVSVEQAIRNAEASLRMEGMQSTPEDLDGCRRVLEGEITLEQYLSILKEQFNVRV